MRCKICGERGVSPLWAFIWVGKDPHTRTIHADFVHWFERFFITAAAFTFVFFFALDTLSRFFPVDRVTDAFLAQYLPNPPDDLYVSLLLLGEALVVVIYFDVKLYRYKSDWRRKH